MAGQILAALRAEERQARRDLILDAARRLFAQKDFRSVTVRQIARAAGISPGTIYRYYANLDALFIDVLLVGAREMIGAVDTALSGAEECPLQRFCRIYITFLNDHMAFYQMMGHFMLGGSLPPAKTDELNRVMRRLMDRVEAVVRRAGRREPGRRTAHALFAALNGIMISYARYPGRDPEEIRRHTLALAEVVAERFAPRRPS